MIEFIIYYFLIGLGLNQLIGAYAQYRIGKETGQAVSVNYEQVVNTAFAWPIILWNSISGLFGKGGEEE